jgi:hypothetical protein
VKEWATPTTRDWKDGDCRAANVETNGLLGRQTVREPGAPVGPLNPAWEEPLMGLPIGWTERPVSQAGPDGRPVAAPNSTRGSRRARATASRTEESG